MKLSPCGVDCSSCHLFDKCKKDCNESQGKPFYITDSSIGLEVCDIYDCVRNKKNLKHCGECEDLPCQIFFDWKDPDFTDEEHQEDIKQRVDRLKNKS
jgi:hypothetical protein